MAVVMYLSGDAWSAEETRGPLGVVFAWVFPTATPAQLVALHGVARTTAHLTVYAILALLWRRALRETAGAARGSAWIALGVSIAWAMVDEAHQATVSTRTGSGVDVLVDTVGAAVALVVAQRDWRSILDRATTVVLWVVVGGGLAALMINAAAGVESLALWITTPAGALLLAWHWHSRRRRP
jgi:VanZ family protein